METPQTSVGCTTTLDLVRRQQQYATKSLHGSKRSHEEINDINPVSVGFNNGADITTAHDLVKLPSLESCAKNRIVASNICNLNRATSKPLSESITRKPVKPPPGPSQNPLLSLSHPRYGLPEILVKNLASLGINSIYPWQSSCLLGRDLLTGKKNLVYTAPTGGGKSLVADILMLKRVIEDPSKKAILVLPYVALVQEKLKWLRKVVEGLRKDCDASSQAISSVPAWRRPHNSSVRVVGFFGGSKARATWSDVDVAICTIEKVTYYAARNPSLLT